MRVKFLVVVEAEGAGVRDAYAKVCRGLRCAAGLDWRDTDDASIVGDGEDDEPVPEKELQKARQAWLASKDARRACRAGPTCDHDVVVDGVPYCMMTDAEIRATIRRGQRLSAGDLSAFGR